MPQIALLICTAFVFFLLRLEHKQAEVTRSLWIPVIWMLSIASKPIGTWFNVGNEGIESGSSWDRIFQSGLFCVGVIVLIRKKFDFTKAIKENAWTIVLIGYMFISVIWSDIPLISFKRWFREVIAVIMAFLVLAEPSPRLACEMLFKRIVYILIPFSLLLIRYFPQYGRQYHHWSGAEMWVGVTQQKNGLGRLCIFAILFLVWKIVSRSKQRNIPNDKYEKSADMLILAISLWLLKGPPGMFPATASVACVGGLTIFFMLLWIKKHHFNMGAFPLIALISVIMCIGVIAPMTGGSVVSSFSSSVGRNETLTGRTDIWAVLVPMAMRQPIFGSGFGGFWTPATEAAAYYVKEAHNGYLDVFLGIGAFGILLTSLVILSYAWRALNSLAIDYTWGCLFIAYVIMTLLHDITESTIESFQRHLMAVLLFMSVSIQTSYETSGITPIVNKKIKKKYPISRFKVTKPKLENRA